MKLSVLNKQLRDFPFEKQIQIIKETGYDGVALGTGGLSHATVDVCYAPRLIQDEKRIDEYKHILKHYDVEVCSFACIANPVHPQKRVAKKMDDDLRATVLLAEKFGVDTITTTSGLPGDHPGAMYPSWVAYNWPSDAMKISEYQWDKVLIPYWQDFTAFAKQHNVSRIGIELSTNFSCHNLYTFQKLRSAIGPEIGIVFDPSHFWYLGMDALTVVSELKGAIYCVHGKDIYIRERNRMRNGWLDMVPEFEKKSWQFTTPGYGHGDEFWRRFIVELRMAGYERDICNENEDVKQNDIEAMIKYVEYLKPIIFEKPASDYYWARDVMKEVFAYLDDSEGYQNESL